MLGYGLFGQSRRYVTIQINIRKKLAELVSKFAIGQRCFLLETQDGNVLWDMISLLDEPITEFVGTVFAFNKEQ